jgi:4-hydroxy-2-oxoheptanedioate aldolase
VAPNRTREQLTHGRPVFGCLLRYPDASLAELLALQGLDFVIFDGEHGTLAPSACEHLARAVELHGVTPGVRVEENRAAALLRYLDAGAQICHVPGIDSAEDAARAVRAVKFRPHGDRGLSASRASRFGAPGGYPAYTTEANRQTQVVAHIESAAGVAAAQEIAAVDGVDVLLFGALDLSHDLGYPGEVEHPELVACAERVATAAGTAGKALGAVAGDTTSVRRWLERGARYILATVESFVAPSVVAYLAEARR